MSHDHIGIPRLLQQGFASEDQAYCYDTIRNKGYFSNIDTLGTKHNYYDEDVEKKILAEDVENKFGVFYNEMCDNSDLKYLKELIDGNKSIIEEFYSFMFLRSKKIVEQINKESVTAQFLGDYSHSELLRIQYKVKKNMLDSLGSDYSVYPLMNYANSNFINNSIGFCMIENSGKVDYIFIPFDIKRGLIISSNEEIKNNFGLVINPGENWKVDTINKHICRMESLYGNGFIFGIQQDQVENYIDILNEMISKNKK